MPPCKLNRSRAPRRGPVRCLGAKPLGSRRLPRQPLQRADQVGRATRPSNTCKHTLTSTYLSSQPKPPECPSPSHPPPSPDPRARPRTPQQPWRARPSWFLRWCCARRSWRRLAPCSPSGASAVRAASCAGHNVRAGLAAIGRSRWGGLRPQICGTRLPRGTRAAMHAQSHML